MGCNFCRNFEHHNILGLFIIVVLVAAMVECSSLNYTKYNKQVSSLRFNRIIKHLDKINKRPVLTIESPDGDIIDCVQKRKQLAFDHPLLKNHKIQKAPKEMPRGIINNVKKDNNNNNNNEDENGSSNEIVGEGERGAVVKRQEWQMWHLNGTLCPKGTVPIRRSRVDDLFRAKSLYHYGKKQPRTPFSRRIHSDAPDVISGNGHEHAIAYTRSSEEIYGTKASINVWDPSIQAMNEFSLSQIWILSGSFDGPDLNSIEAGWQVSPELYGDNRPRLFTYWTSDSYQQTGCYNLLCSGFIQTNSKIAIGAAISPVSSFAGSQYDITILIWKDPKAGNWWMSFGDNTLVGYWPAELFTHLADHATMVEWGGEVVNMRTNGQHTETQMGSGHFARESFGKSSYFRNLQIVDTDNSLMNVQGISTLAENTNCYDIKSSYSNEWGTYFYYGGPGNNPQCP